MRWIIFPLVLVGCSSEPVRIVHIKNWHWIPRESFAVELRNDQPELTDLEIEARYARFLGDVEELQQEQVEVLRRLIQSSGLKSVFYEGVTAENHETYIDAVGRARKLRSVVSEAAELDAPELIDEAKRLQAEFRETLLQLGAVGRLMVDGDLSDVSPLDEADLLKTANPIQGGKIAFDAAADEAREDTMARRLMAAGPVAVVILGGEHDLADNLRKVSRSHTYTKLQTPKYLELEGAK